MHKAHADDFAILHIELHAIARKAQLSVVTFTNQGIGNSLFMTKFVFRLITLLKEKNSGAILETTKRFRHDTTMLGLPLNCIILFSDRADFSFPHCVHVNIP